MADLSLQSSTELSRMNGSHCFVGEDPVIPKRPIQVNSPAGLSKLIEKTLTSTVSKEASLKTTRVTDIQGLKHSLPTALLALSHQESNFPSPEISNSQLKVTEALNALQRFIAQGSYNPFDFSSDDRMFQKLNHQMPLPAISFANF